MDPHVVTGVLKLFITELPENLFTDKLFEEFEKLSRNLKSWNISVKNSLDLQNPEEIKKVHDLFSQLPNCNQASLKLLLGHLQRLIHKCANISNVGKFNSITVGSSFGTKYSKIFPLLIEFYNEIFPASEK